MHATAAGARHGGGHAVRQVEHLRREGQVSVRGSALLNGNAQSAWFDPRTQRCWLDHSCLFWCITDEFNIHIMGA